MSMHIKHFCEQCEGCRIYRPALRKDPFVENTHVNIEGIDAMVYLGSNLFYPNGAPYLLLVDRKSGFLSV